MAVSQVVSTKHEQKYSAPQPIAILRLYAANLSVCLGALCLPAVIHCIWDVVCLIITNLHTGDWPPEPILVNSDWGLTIHSTSLGLSFGGWLVFLAAAGASIVPMLCLVKMRGEAGETVPLRPQWEMVGVQATAVACAWGAACAGFVFNTLYSALVLAKPGASNLALAIWYLASGFTVLFALPFGFWMQVRYGFAVPAAVSVPRIQRRPLRQSCDLTRGLRLRIAALVLIVASLRLLCGAGLGSLLRGYCATHGLTGWAVAVAIPALGSLLLDVLIGPLYALGIACLLYSRPNLQLAD